MHLGAESWGGVGGASGNKSLPGEQRLQQSSLPPPLCLCYSNGASGTLLASKLTFSNLILGLQVLRAESMFSGPTNPHVQSPRLSRYARSAHEGCMWASILLAAALGAWRDGGGRAEWKGWVGGGGSVLLEDESTHQSALVRVHSYSLGADVQEWSRGRF